MEPVERGAGDQPSQELPKTWESLQESQPPPSAANHAPPSSAEAAAPFREQPQQTSPASQRPLGGAPEQDDRIDPPLAILDGAARELAAAERADILPLALRAFLALCEAGRGLVLTRVEGTAGCQVALREQTPADLAERFTREPRFWASLPGAVVFAAARADGASHRQQAPDPSLLCPADAAAGWHAWLPLALAEGEAAVLIARGAGDLPSAAWRERVRLAGAVLGGLVAAAWERARLREWLSQKDQARDQFVSLAAHELKSPLAVIKGYAQLLLRQARRPNAAEHIDLSGLEAISQQVSRMSHLVGELADFSRIERGTLEIDLALLDVVALVRRVVEQRQRTLPEITFSLIAREPELMVLADRTRLEQVLGVLLDNAARFGQASGIVEVTVQQAQAASQPIPPSLEEETGAVNQSNVALISVRDYGPGLPEAERAHLFTPFYRGPEHSLQRQLAGVGLGLYLSRYLVARQHGRLWAEFPGGDPAAGSIFSLSLPLSPAS